MCVCVWERGVHVCVEKDKNDAAVYWVTVTAQYQSYVSSYYITYVQPTKGNAWDKRTKERQNI